MHRCAAVGVCLLGLARLPASADDRVLHEYVPDLRPNEAALAVAAQSEAVVYGDEVLTAPGADGLAQAAPAFVATAGDGVLGDEPGQRSPSFRPDRLTELEGQLSYYAAFTPAIAPFKRVSSLDAVTLDQDGKTPLLVVRDGRRKQVGVDRPGRDPALEAGRDRFWGDVMLDFRAGRVVPLPSVSPHSRILSLRTEPTVSLHIERDSADNFYARLAGPAPSQPVRVTFLTDAPRSYFGAELPRVPLSAMKAEAPSLPAALRRRALAFAAELGVSPQSDFRSALHALTRHFREFTESAQAPHDTGDVYLDLARAKKGVCRHRAYAFVVTAHALGMPARFVQNEAHSWVEVKLPGGGYLRVDLGGAAHGLTSHGTDDRPSYVPTHPDDLPRPASYRESYSLAAAAAEAQRVASQDALTGRWISASTAGSASPEAAAMLSAGSGAARAGRTQRKALAITLDERRQSVLRGGKLSLQGRLTQSSGAGVAGLRVEISLAAQTRKDRMLLGVTVTDDAGYFRATLGVPADLAVGDYRIIVLTPGNTEYLPVVAE